jgi:glycosyltransferase involved in cell wall biosynthesis
MGKNNKKSKASKGSKTTMPFVTLCTPTFNRRPFIPIMLKCFALQTYPKDRIEWIIVDDGTDKIEDLVSNIPQIRYMKFDEKLTLGRKRNICNENAKGDILIYIDDDDYYPPERISHAVETLQKNPTALCAGSSAMYLYFKHINKMYQFGPYGANHATAATFAFRKELLKQTKFDETACVAEERPFLKDYTVPFVQLDPKKTILVFSHIHNSFDKKELLQNLPNKNIHETPVLPSDIVTDTDILTFFMEDIDILLEQYEPGSVKNKPDVIKQIAEIKEKRSKAIKEHQTKQIEYQTAIKNIKQISTPKNQEDVIIEQSKLIQKLIIENNSLKEKMKHLEDKLKEIVNNQIQQRLAEKKQANI